MTTMNISLPENLKGFVDSQVQLGGYSTSSEYIRELIREDQKKKLECAAPRFFVGNGAGSTAHYFVGTGMWGTA